MFRSLILSKTFPYSSHYRFKHTNIIDGKAIAEKILQRCHEQSKDFLSNYARRPKLVAILVGGNESSKLYVRNKQRLGHHVGIDFQVINHLMHIHPSQLHQTIEQLNCDESVDGILLQLPLPLHLLSRTDEFVDRIDRSKDVDGHTRVNHQLYRDTTKALITIPVVAAVREILLHLNEPLQGKHAVVIGRSKYVGTPLALMLSQSTTHGEYPLISGATVTICHRETHLNELTWFCKHADLIISAVGRPKLVTHRMVKEGAIVIDVGISKSWTDKAVVNKQRFVGDVDFEEVQRLARWITPVPGGVGPITLACLMSNLLRLAQHRQITKNT